MKNTSKKDETKIFSFLMELDNPISTNDFKDLHWKSKGNLANEYYESVDELKDEKKVKKVKKEDYPIILYFNFFLKKKYDWVNTSSMAKMIEDGLRYSKIITNDTTDYVAGGILTVSKCEKNETPYVIVTALPYKLIN